MGKHFSVAINNNAERNINNKSTQQQCTQRIKGQPELELARASWKPELESDAQPEHVQWMHTDPCSKREGAGRELPSCRSNKKSASTNKIKAINCNCSRQSDGHAAGAGAGAGTEGRDAVDSELNGY